MPTYSPAFVRWLIQKYLYREFVKPYGKENLALNLAWKVMRGNYVDLGGGNLRMLAQGTTPESCLAAALEQYERERDLAKRPF